MFLGGAAMHQKVVWKSASRAQHLIVLTGLASREEGSAHPVSHDLEVLKSHIKKLEEAWTEESVEADDCPRPQLSVVHGIVAENKPTQSSSRRRAGKVAKVG